MSFYCFVIGDSYCKDPSGIFIFFCQLSAESKGISPIFDLLDRLGGCMVHLQFYYDAVVFWILRIEDKILKASICTESKRSKMLSSGR